MLQRIKLRLKPVVTSKYLDCHLHVINYERAKQRLQIWRKQRDGGWKFEAVTMMCSHNIKLLSSFDTRSIEETTSLKVTVVSMVTGWREAREEKRTKCSACKEGAVGDARGHDCLPVPHT